MTVEALDQRLGVCRLPEVENILHDIVAKGILDQWEGVAGDLSDQIDLLVSRGMVDAALEHTAAVAMGADDDAVVAHRVEDELARVSQRVTSMTIGSSYLSINRGESIETLLDDVVAVEILDELDHPIFQRVDDRLDL